MSMTTERHATNSDATEKLMNAGASRIFSFMSRHTAAVRVTASAAPQQRQLVNATVQIDGATVDKSDISNPGLILVPKHVSKALNSVANKARRAPFRYGVPFVEVAYLVPIADGSDTSPIAKLFAEVNQRAAEYSEKAEELWPDYEAHTDKLRRHPDLYNFEKCLLDKEAWLAQHTIRCDTFPLAGLAPNYAEQVATAIQARYHPGDAGTREINEAAAELGRIADQVAASSSNMSFVGSLQDTGAWAQQANEAAARLATEAATEMVKAPVNELIATLSNFESILSKGGTVRKDSLQRVREAYEKIRGFDFVMPESYKNRLNMLGHKLDQADVGSLSGAVNAGTAMALAEYLGTIRRDLVEGEANDVSLGEVSVMIDFN